MRLFVQLLDSVEREGYAGIPFLFTIQGHGALRVSGRRLTCPLFKSLLSWHWLRSNHETRQFAFANNVKGHIHEVNRIRQPIVWMMKTTGQAGYLSANSKE